MYQYITAYSSAIKFTCLIQRNVCVKNPIKNKLVIPNCQALLLGENYTEIKAWQLKFA